MSKPTDNHPIDEYFAQFDYVQPIFICCSSCGVDNVIFHGYYTSQGITLPKYCPSCGVVLGDANGSSTGAKH